MGLEIRAVLKMSPSFRTVCLRFAGVIGRNFTHQTISQAIGFFDKDKFIFNLP